MAPRRGDRMAVLLAARLVGCIGIDARVTGPVLVHCLRLYDGPTGLLDLTHGRRHRDLLEQQSEQRDQRDAGAMATALEQG